MNKLERELILHFQEAVSLSDIIKEHELYVSSSIGIALYPKDTQDDLFLLKHADAAMYKAKDKGCNNFQFYGQQQQ